jgi:quercetin dioxygenase-like cupin family protein
MKRILFSVFLLLLCSELYSQNVLGGTPQQETKAIQIYADSLKWNDAKPPLAPGAKIAVLEGNPKESGHFTIRVKMPPYYKIPPHVHPVDERATVLAGAMYVGFGDVMDTTKANNISAGCFYINPAGMHHYAFTGKEETILQISTNGPWGLNYIETMNGKSAGAQEKK